MARGWRVIDATSFDGIISGTRGKIVFTSKEKGRQELPAEELAVIIFGTNTGITSAGLHYTTKHDVTLLASDWKGVPYAGIHSWGDHSRVAARHRAQASLAIPRSKNAWMQIVQAKVLGQAATLSLVDSDGAQELKKLAQTIRSGDPKNVEGTAARYYWKRLFPHIDKFTRDTYGDDDVNAMLNYGYTVLRGFGIRAVTGAGLAPSLGVFHRGRSNYFNLVDDLIEPFRPAIDATVLSLDRRSSLEHSETKKMIVASASQKFNADGVRIPTAFDNLAQQYGRYVEGDIIKLEVEPWKGPQPT